MALAARLAHLVGGTISEVGRRARSASAGRGWLAPRMLVAAFFLLMLSVGFVDRPGRFGRPPGPRPSGAARRATADGRGATAGGPAQPDRPTTRATPCWSSSARRVPPCCRAATGAPAPASAAAADQPPLATRENFAFAPYWTLGQAPDLRHHRTVHHRLLRHRREPRRQPRRERSRAGRASRARTWSTSFRGRTRRASGWCSPSTTSARARSTR